MWKRNQPESRPTPPARPAAAAAAAPSASRPSASGPTSTATIGPSISIHGDLTGEEDLLIEGKIEGEIKFANHSVTVGRNGRVQADVYGKSICIEGQVFGNLWGQDEVVIRQTGKVEGNLTAPRVTLEDGSSFRGAIDMQSPQAREREREKQAAAGAKDPSSASATAKAERPASPAAGGGRSEPAPQRSGGGASGAPSPVQAKQS